MNEVKPARPTSLTDAETQDVMRLMGRFGATKTLTVARCVNKQTGQVESVLAGLELGETLDGQRAARLIYLATLLVPGEDLYEPPTPEHNPPLPGEAPPSNLILPPHLRRPA